MSSLAAAPAYAQIDLQCGFSFQQNPRELRQMARELANIQMRLTTGLIFSVIHEPELGSLIPSSVNSAIRTEKQRGELFLSILAAAADENVAFEKLENLLDPTGVLGPYDAVLRQRVFEYLDQRGLRRAPLVDGLVQRMTIDDATNYLRRTFRENNVNTTNLFLSVLADLHTQGVATSPAEAELRIIRSFLRMDPRVQAVAARFYTDNILLGDVDSLHFNLQQPYPSQIEIGSQDAVGFVMKVYGETEFEALVMAQHALIQLEMDLLDAGNIELHTEFQLHRAGVEIDVVPNQTPLQYGNYHAVIDFGQLNIQERNEMYAIIMALAGYLTP